MAPTRATHASQYGSRALDRGLRTAVTAYNAHSNKYTHKSNEECTVNNNELHAGSCNRVQAVAHTVCAHFGRTASTRLMQVRPLAHASAGGTDI